MQKFVARITMFIAVIGLFTFLSTPAIYAQESAQPSPATQPPQQSQTTVSDEELQSFAKAYVEIEAIRVSHEAALNNTQEPEQAQQIQQDANAKMVEAVEKQGMTVEGYAQILNAVNSNGVLAKRALDLIAKEKAS